MRPAPIFYLIVFYSFLQLGWWTYLLVELNNEVASLKTEMLMHSSEDHEAVMIKRRELDSKLHARYMMVLGEGSVFTLFMVLGIFNMRKAMRKETELSRQQNNFLLSVTHELKSPIASVKLYLQTLMKRDLEKEKQQEFLGNALHDTERLGLLVENLLTAARLEEQGYTYKKEDTDLTALVRDTCMRLPAHKTKKVNLTVKADDGIRMMADPVAMESLVNNLTENAVKYSPPGSGVLVELKRTEGQIIFRVSDEGSGVPEAERKMIFRKFYRIGNEQTRDTKGTGLGLYIVQHIARGHQGKISIRNNSPKGSIFEVQFA